MRIGVQTQGQGHETTFAQIVAEELGLAVENIEVEHGDTDTAPYGLGTYASRSTPTAGAATAMAARKIRDKASHLAAHLLECSVDDLEWKDYQFQVKGAPERSKTMTDLAFAAYTNHPQGMEAGLEAVCYYDPPNLTFPFGAYIAVIDIDRGTGEVKVRRFVAIDDCGTVINPMVVEGQIHGGLTMGLAPALYEQIWYDEQGNMHGGTLMDYLVPTAMETPAWETERTVTPSPHHPLGAKGVGESATVGAPPAIVNAVVDALSPPRRDARRDSDHAAAAVAHSSRKRASRSDVTRRRRLLERAAALRHAGRAIRAGDGRAQRQACLGPARRPRAADRRRRVARLGRRRVRANVDRARGPLALADGAPRLVRLSPEPAPEDGIVSYPMTCHSGGTLEIYLEPVLPAPSWSRSGDSPVSRGARALGPPLGFRVARCARDARHPDAWVVAAAMSSDEDHPAASAKRSPAARPTSRWSAAAARRRPARRAARRGIPKTPTRLKAPAGLDIGAADARRNRAEHPGRDRPPPPRRAACASHRRSVTSGRHRPHLRHGSRRRERQVDRRKRRPDLLLLRPRLPQGLPGRGVALARDYVSATAACDRIVACSTFPTRSS